MPGLLPRTAAGGTRDRPGLSLRLAIRRTRACGPVVRLSSRALMAKPAWEAVWARSVMRARSATRAAPATAAGARAGTWAWPATPGSPGRSGLPQVRAATLAGTLARVTAQSRPGRLATWPAWAYSRVRQGAMLGPAHPRVLAGRMAMAQVPECPRTAPLVRVWAQPRAPAGLSAIPQPRAHRRAPRSRELAQPGSLAQPGMSVRLRTTAQPGSAVRGPAWVVRAGERALPVPSLGSPGQMLLPRAAPGRNNSARSARSSPPRHIPLRRGRFLRLRRVHPFRLRLRRSRPFCLRLHRSRPFRLCRSRSFRLRLRRSRPFRLRLHRSRPLRLRRSRPFRLRLHRSRPLRLRPDHPFRLRLRRSRPFRLRLHRSRPLRLCRSRPFRLRLSRGRPRH
jgi:hypothetical protein